MKKLRLSLDDLRVESFATASGSVRSGTVYGLSGADATCVNDPGCEQTPAGGCYYTVGCSEFTCGNQCSNASPSCYGGCGVTDERTGCNFPTCQETCQRDTVCGCDG